MKEEFTEIINSKDLKDISVDLVESVLDNQITDEVLKEVPIVKSIIAVKNIYHSISDKIFIKKALNVLLELKDIEPKQRNKFVKEMEDEYSTGAERILLAIEKLDTYEKCKIFGILSLLKAKNVIDLNSYLRLIKVIQDAYLRDLLLIRYLDRNSKNEVYEEEFYPLISLDLIYQEQSEQTPIKKSEFAEYHGREEYEGGEIKFYYLLTDIGKTLLDIIYELFPDEKP